MKTTDLFTHRLVRGLAFVAAVALSSAGCGGGSTEPAANAAPTLAFQSPTLDVEGAVGIVVTVTYTAHDPDDDALTAVYADRDGDLATTGDQFEVVANVRESNGIVLAANWDTGSVPEGRYHLIGRIDDGTNTPTVVSCPGTIAVWNTYPHDHTNVVLRDRYGDAIRAGSTEPYSPRETCGRCHDVDSISNNFHTQQGRTNGLGDIITKDDFFGDRRDWLLSDGMYGKW